MHCYYQMTMHDERDEIHMRNLKNIMEGITREEDSCSICYIGTKAALINAGLAKEYMFAAPPKSLKSGWLDEKGRRIPEDEALSGDQYDWFSDSRPIQWKTVRREEDQYVLFIAKSRRQIKQESKETNRILGYRKQVKSISTEAIKSILDSVGGEVENNPDGYCLQNYEEIFALASKLHAAVSSGKIRKNKRPQLSLVK